MTVHKKAGLYRIAGKKCKDLHVKLECERVKHLLNILLQVLRKPFLFSL